MVEACTARAEHRILVLDVLRGAAILAILPMNLQLFAMPSAAFSNPYACPWTDSVNVFVWLLLHVGIGHKDLVVFSMLFGVGLSLIDQRLAPHGYRANIIHYRRVGVLALVGMLHAYFVWSGDILVTYALCGFVLHGLRNLRPKTLVVLGLLVYSVPLLLLANGDRWLAAILSPDSLAEIYAGFRPTADQWTRHIADLTGTWSHELQHRAEQTLLIQLVLIPAGLFWICGGMMLAGIGLSRLGMFDARWSKRTYVSLAAAGLTIGWSLLMFGVYRHFQHNWSAEYSMIRGRLYAECASPVMAVGWISLWVLICRAGRFAWITARLAEVGRLALSNYLLQSLIATFIFYGIGLGWVGQVDRLQQLGITAFIAAFQLCVSHLWLRRYRLGPFEWLWRRLTYGRPQPLRP